MSYLYLFYIYSSSTRYLLRLMSGGCVWWGVVQSDVSYSTRHHHTTSKYYFKFINSHPSLLILCVSYRMGASIIIRSYTPKTKLLLRLIQFVYIYTGWYYFRQVRRASSDHQHSHSGETKNGVLGGSSAVKMTPWYLVLLTSKMSLDGTFAP